MFELTVYAIVPCEKTKVGPVSIIDPRTSTQMHIAHDRKAGDGLY